MVLRPSCSRRNLLPVTVPAAPRNVRVATMASSAFSPLVADGNVVRRQCQLRVIPTIATCRACARELGPVLSVRRFAYWGGLSTLLLLAGKRDDQFHADIDHAQPCWHAVAQLSARCG